MAAEDEVELRLRPVRLALRAALRAAAAARAAVRELGYPRPTDEQWRSISEAITLECLAAALVLADDPSVTEEQLGAAAGETGRRAVLEQLGPPPGAN